MHIYINYLYHIHISFISVLHNMRRSRKGSRLTIFIEKVLQSKQVSWWNPSPNLRTQGRQLLWQVTRRTYMFKQAAKSILHTNMAHCLHLLHSHTCYSRPHLSCCNTSACGPSLLSMGAECDFQVMLLPTIKNNNNKTEALILEKRCKSLTCSKNTNGWSQRKFW